MPVKPYEEGIVGRSLPGMKLLHHNAKLRPYTMSYAKGTTVIRPWGTILPDGSMAPWRDQEGGFGTSWLVQDMVCMGWGIDMRFTCFLSVEDTDEWPGGSPLQIFLDDMRANANFKDVMFKKPQNSFAPISNPKACGFIKGLLIECGGKSFSDNPIWGVLLILAPSANEALDELVNREVGGDVGDSSTEVDPHGWNAKYTIGDPIGLAAGKVLEFNKESAFVDKAKAGVNLDGRTLGGNAANRGNEIDRYGCRLWPHNTNLSLLDQADKVARNDQSFEDAFRYMTGKEQLEELIIPGFGRSSREAVMFSFGGKGVLPASFEAGRKAVDMGANKEPGDGGQPADVVKQQETPATPPQGLVNLGGPDSHTTDPQSGSDDQAAAGADAEPVKESSDGDDTANDIRNRLANLNKSN